MNEDNKDEKLNQVAGQNAEGPEHGEGSQESPASVGSTESEVEKLKKEKDEYLNGWKRAKADLINYQKDEGKRFEEMMNYSREMIISDIIPVLDSFELALAAHSPVRGSEDSQLQASNGDGLQRIRIQLEDTLKRYSLEKIKVSPGDTFDTNLHESIGEQENKELKSGTIAVEVSSGYKLKNKVIRPARVKLAK
ncbi:MAG: nucleotide exchange factor GrpE [bacterium]|nr:nucleotide exchange factor GrpE [bacterium]